MIILLNLSLPENARSRVFWDSPALLQEMLEYTHGVVVDRFPAAVVVANPAILPFLTDANMAIDLTVDTSPADPEGVVDWALTTVDLPPEKSLLVVSPFMGVVCPERLDAFLDYKRSVRPLVSAKPVMANVNPFWMNMISPMSRVGRSAYIDRNKTMMPKFTQAASVVNQNRWRELIGDLEIYGSQWLPKLHKLDGALVLLRSRQAESLSPALLDEPGLVDLPLLYQLPLFDMASHISASLRRPVSEEDGTINLEQARTAMRCMEREGCDAEPLQPEWPAGHYQS